MTGAEKRTALVDNARRYIGFTDASHFAMVYNNAVHYEAMYKTWPWCAAFVSAMAVECGLTDIIPLQISCCMMIALFADKGRFIEDDGYTPRKGDIIFFDWEGSTDYDSRGGSETDHVGIVSDCSNGIIYTIEGNRGGEVKAASYPVGSKYISGFGCPDYGDDDKEAAPAPLPLTKYGASGNAVKAIQALLNVRNNAHLTVDGSFGSNTLKAVKDWQKKAVLDVDGEVGPLTWASLFSVG